MKKAAALLLFGSCWIAVGEQICTLSVLPVPVDVKTVPSSDSASIMVIWKWNGTEFHCIQRTFVSYRVSGDKRSMAVRITLNSISATNLTLQNLMCNKQYVIFVTSRLGMNMGSRESKEVTTLATCQGTPGTVTSPTIPTGDETTGDEPTVGKMLRETSSSVPTAIPTSDKTTGGEPSGRTSLIVPAATPSTGTPTSGESSSIHATPSIPTGGEPSGRTSLSVPAATPSTGTPTSGESSSIPTATPSIPTGGEATTTHSTPAGGEPSNRTSSVDESGMDSAPIIGTAAVLAGAVLLVVLVITILAVRIRWHKWKKKRILSHIPVELSDIHTACASDSSIKNSTGKTTDVDNDYYEAVKITTSGVPIMSWSDGIHQITMTNEEGCATKRVVLAESKQEVQGSAAVESKLVEVAKFGEYVSSLHAQNNAGFTSQYRALPSGESGQSVQVAKNNQNRNRFCNIVTYDDHSITLNPISTHANCRHNYINASYVDGYSKPQKYIATQGPLPNSVTDIWRLVWQEKVRVVVMLTNVVEGGQRKCEQYWPDQEPQEYGPFTVTLADRQVFADYIIRTLQVKRGDSLRRVIQFHFTTWPDHGVPEYAGTILTFLRRVNSQHISSKGPLLIHCSAGVGRTGTLITIDTALEQAAKEGTVDIPAIVSKIRRQRMKMVQTVDQYSFIHDAVLEFLICGNTQILASDLKGAIKNMATSDNQSMKTRFEMEFLVLDQVSPKPTEVITTATRYPQKNRSSEFLPADKWRVILKAGKPDYINASFANGYKQYKGFIITQAPLKTTCQDFWKMVFERECGLIVMLSDVVEDAEEICYQYWPGNTGDKGTQECGEFSISTLEAVNQDGFVRRLFGITNPKSGRTHKVTQLQLGNWTPEGLCASPKTIVDVTDLLFAVQRSSGNKSVVVHGSDTVTRCGIFCAFINVVECCKTEGIVDVFQAVKALRIQKPGSVLTVEQYRFIFDLALLFLDSFEIYSNFK